MTSPYQSDNPIKDTKRDGKLTGRELRDQLLAEDDKGLPRAEKRVHGAIAAFASQRATSWRNNLQRMEQGSVSFRYLEAHRLEFAQWLAKNITEAVEEYETNLDYLADKAKEIVFSGKKSAADKENELSDLRHFTAFAAHFRKDFPQGIDIKPDDLVDILRHFDPRMLPGYGLRAPSCDNKCVDMGEQCVVIEKKCREI